MKGRLLELSNNNVLGDLINAVYDGETNRVIELTRQALEHGIAPGRVVDEGLIKGMDAVGVDFKSGTLFVPEVLVAAQAMHGGMKIIRPLLVEKDYAPVGKIVIGTVEGDLHDIGKNLVAMMMEGAGFEINDLGIDVPAERFVEVVKETQPEVVGLSALLSTTMSTMKATIDALAEAGLRNKVKVLVGGAPISRSFSEEIGADGYASDAAGAVDEAKRLLGLN